jgi:hypothetical protein
MDRATPADDAMQCTAGNDRFVAMAFEPFNIFSRRIDPRGVIAVLRKLVDKLTVEGPEDDWQQVVVLGPKKLLRKPARLVISHDSAYYDGPGWSNQIQGMANYFSRFPEVPLKPDVLRAIHSFRFILAFPEADLDINSRDERVAWVHAVCRHLDGVIFTPSSLRDSSGRFLISADGDCDPNAVPPAIPSTENQPNAESEDDSADAEEEDEEAEPEIPAADRVATRALVLAAVTNRALIEKDRAEIDQPEEIQKRILEWIEVSAIGGEVEPNEWKVLQRPVGSLEQQDAINAVWRLEGLGVLLWALGLYELPRYDELVTPNDLFEAACLGDAESARGLIAEARLRAPEELAEYQTHAFMAHWRLRNFSLTPTAMDFIEFSKTCWFGTFDVRPFHVLKNDMALGDKPIAEADRELVGTCQSSAMERHRAINWLFGYNKIYSETGTDT